MTRILFTGGGGAGNEALARLFDRRYECHFADADLSAINDAIPAERRHAIPMARDPDFVKALAALCERLTIDLLVPGVDEELPFLPALSAAAPGLHILAPEAAYIARMNDKLTMPAALRQAGLDAPWTLPGDRADEAEFPAIAKPRQGRGSRAVHLVEDAAAFDAYLRLEGLAPEAVVLQERAIGTEYTVQMVCDSAGQLRAVVPVHVGIKRGITILAETADSPTVDAACRAIHAAWPTGGCYNIQLIVTEDGRVLPFEINPRISTTFCLVVAAGVDPIAVFLGLAPETPRTIAFRHGVGLRRFWRNSFTGTETEQ